MVDVDSMNASSRPPDSFASLLSCLCTCCIQTASTKGERGSAGESANDRRESERVSKEPNKVLNQQGENKEEEARSHFPFGRSVVLLSFVLHFPVIWSRLSTIFWSFHLLERI